MEKDRGKIRPLGGELPSEEIPPIIVRGAVNSYNIGKDISGAGYTVSVAGEKDRTVITVQTDKAREAALAIP